MIFICFACDLKSSLISILVTWFIGKVVLEKFWFIEEDDEDQKVLLSLSLIFILISTYLCMWSVLTYVAGLQKMIRM